MSEVNQNVNNEDYEDVYDPMLLDATGKDMVQALEGISQGIGELAEKIHPTAEDIPTSAIPGEDNVEDALKTVDNKIEELDGTVVKTVNAIRPDENGELKLTKVAYADNLTSDKTQNSEGEFVIRTAGGDASIADGDAFVMRVYGNRVHEGYVPESLSMNVVMAERVAPSPITAVLDDATFEAYVEEAGTYTLSYTNAWDKTPGDYGVTVTGTPLSGDQIVITWDGETSPFMSVIAPRSAPGPIAATIDRDTFVGYVAQSGITTLTYTTMWSANPALYGVTVTGTPVSGDTITITYYKEERGTIKVANPTALKSTGWNLYNHTAGYAYLTKYSSQYGFRIGGAYTALQYSETLTGAKTTITPVDGVFTIPDDGYVWVTGGNGTDTYIINQWSDWTEGPAGEFEAYSETVVDLSTVMSTYFPNGLLRVGVIRDEINLNASAAISKIDRMAYSAENLAAAKASGRAFEYDTNYIYIVKASYVTSAIVLDGSYIASDHGNEFFTGSEIPVYLETMYGNNLKNKLERDVLTVSQQTLTAAQKAQVLQNIGAASQSGLDTLPTATLNSDLNNELTPGWYLLGNSCTNTPPVLSGGKLHIEQGSSSNYVRQTYYGGYNPEIYTRARYYYNGAWHWNAWQEVTNFDLNTNLTNRTGLVYDTFASDASALALAKYNIVKNYGPGTYNVAGGWQGNESGTTKVSIVDSSNAIVIFNGTNNSYIAYINNNAVSKISRFITDVDVVNNLTSMSGSRPLSAAQGKALNDNIHSIIKSKNITGTIDNNGFLNTDLKSSECIIVGIPYFYFDGYARNAYRYDVLNFGGSNNVYYGLKFYYWDDSVLGKNKEVTITVKYINYSSLT